MLHVTVRGYSDCVSSPHLLDALPAIDRKCPWRLTRLKCSNLDFWFRSRWLNPWCHPCDLQVRFAASSLAAVLLAVWRIIIYSDSMYCRLITADGIPNAALRILMISLSFSCSICWAWCIQFAGLGFLAEYPGRIDEFVSLRLS